MEPSGDPYNGSPSSGVGDSPKMDSDKGGVDNVNAKQNNSENGVKSEKRFYGSNELSSFLLPRQIPQEHFSLYHCFGIDSRKRQNIQYVRDNVVITLAGNLVQIIDLITSETRYIIGKDGGGSTCVAVHPSRNLFAVGERSPGKKSPNIYIYEYPSLRVAKILREGTEKVYSTLAFSGNGDALASVGAASDFTLSIWKWKEEKLLLKSKAYGQDIYQVRFAPENDGILTTSGTGHIRFWKMASTFTGLKLQGDIGKFGKVELCDVEDFCILPDGKVLSSSEAGTMLLWEGNLIKAQIFRKNTAEAELGPNDSREKKSDCGKETPSHGTDQDEEPSRDTLSTMMESGNDDSSRPGGEEETINNTDQSTWSNMSVEDMDDNAKPQPSTETTHRKLATTPLSLSPAHNGAITVLEYDPDSRKIITGGADGTLRWWNISDLDIADGAGEDLAYFVEPDSEFVLHDIDGKRPTIRSLARGNDHWLIQVDEGVLLRVPFSLIKRKAAEKEVTEMMVSCEQKQAKENNHIAGPTEESFSSTSTTIAVQTLVSSHSGSILSLIVSHKRPWTIVAGADGKLSCFDYERRQLVFTQQFRSSCTCLAFAPDSLDPSNSLLAAGFADGVVRVLQMDAKAQCWRRRAVFKPHSTTVQSLAFSSDGRRLCSAGIDGIIFLFDLILKEASVASGSQPKCKSLDVDPIGCVPLCNTDRAEDVSKVALNHDGSLILFYCEGGRSGEILWDKALHHKKECATTQCAESAGSSEAVEPGRSEYSEQLDASTSARKEESLILSATIRELNISEILQSSMCNDSRTSDGQTDRNSSKKMEDFASMDKVQGSGPPSRPSSASTAVAHATEQENGVAFNSRLVDVLYSTIDHNEVYMIVHNRSVSMDKAGGRPASRSTEPKDSTDHRLDRLDAHNSPVDLCGTLLLVYNRKAGKVTTKVSLEPSLLSYQSEFSSSVQLSRTTAANLRSAADESSLLLTSLRLSECGRFLILSGEKANFVQLRPLVNLTTFANLSLLDWTDQPSEVYAAFPHNKSQNLELKSVCDKLNEDTKNKTLKKRKFEIDLKYEKKAIHKAVQVAFAPNGRYLLVGGRDGSVLVLYLNPLKIEKEAKLWSSDLMSSAPSQGERQVYPVKENDSGRRDLGLRIESKAMLSKYKEEETPQTVSGLEDHDEAEDILDPMAFSIQNQRVKRREADKLRQAEQEKERVRALIRQMRKEYQLILEENEKLPEHLRLTDRELNIDFEYTTMLLKEGEKKRIELRQVLQKNVDKAAENLRKVKERFCKGVEMEESHLHSLYGNLEVKSYRLVALSEEKQAKLAEIHMKENLRMRDEERRELMKQQTGKRRKSSFFSGRRRRSTVEKLRRDVQNAGNIREGAQNSKHLADRDMEPIFESGSEEDEESEPLASAGETHSGMNRTHSHSGGAGQGPRGKEGTGNSHSRNDKRREKKMTALEERLHKRKLRKEKLEWLLKQKPQKGEEDPQHRQAIEYARENMGDFKLKSAPDYVVPTNRKLTIDKKEEEILLQEQRLYMLKKQFNHKFSELRNRKYHFIAKLIKTTQTLKEISVGLEELGQMSTSLNLPEFEAKFATGEESKLCYAMKSLYHRIEMADMRNLHTSEPEDDVGLAQTKFTGDQSLFAAHRLQNILAKVCNLAFLRKEWPDLRDKVTKYEICKYILERVDEEEVMEPFASAFEHTLPDREMESRLGSVIDELIAMEQKAEQERKESLEDEEEDTKMLVGNKHKSSSATSASALASIPPGNVAGHTPTQLAGSTGCDTKRDSQGLSTLEQEQILGATISTGTDTAADAEGGASGKEDSDEPLLQHMVEKIESLKKESKLNLLKAAKAILISPEDAWTSTKLIHSTQNSNYPNQALLEEEQEGSTDQQHENDPVPQPVKFLFEDEALNALKEVYKGLNLSANSSSLDRSKELEDRTVLKGEADEETRRPSFIEDPEKVEDYCVAEARRLLMQKQSEIMEVATEIYSIDDSLFELALEKAKADLAVKGAEIRLLILNKELAVLQGCKDMDEALSIRKNTQLAEKAKIEVDLSKTESNLHRAESELQLEVSQQQKLRQELVTLVGEENPLLSKILRIFKRKVNLLKEREENLDDEDSDSEYEFDDDNDDLDSDEEETEEEILNKLNKATSKSVLHLREQRQIVDDRVASLQKTVEELKRNADRLSQREKQIEKELRSTEVELQTLQAEKQKKLNEIPVVIPLRLSQIICNEKDTANILRKAENQRKRVLDERFRRVVDRRTFEAGCGAAKGTENNQIMTRKDSVASEMSEKEQEREDSLDINDYLPRDITKCLVMNLEDIRKLDGRVEELRKENKELKQSFKGLLDEQTKLKKETKQTEKEISEMENKCEELQILKFGRKIDLGDLEKYQKDDVEEEMNEKLRDLDLQHENEISKLKKKHQTLQQRLLEETKKNTELLQTLGSLTETKMKLESSLEQRDILSSLESADLEAEKEKKELKKLLKTSKRQKEEIERLKHEIRRLRTQGTTLPSLDSPAIVTSFPLPKR